MKQRRTKEQLRKDRAAWRQALVEGRAAEYWYEDDLGTDRRVLRTFITHEDLAEFLARADATDVRARKIQFTLEEQAASLGLPGVPEHWRDA